MVVRKRQPNTTVVISQEEADEGLHSRTRKKEGFIELESTEFYDFKYEERGKQTKKMIQSFFYFNLNSIN